MTLPPWLYRPAQRTVVHGLDQVHPGVGEQRADDPRDEVGGELPQVGVDETDDVPGGGQQRAPQDLALARHGRYARQDVVPVDDARPGRRGHLGRTVGRPRVDDDYLVDERDLVHEVVPDDRDDVTDRLLLVQRGQDDGHRLVGGALRGQDPVQRTVGQGPGAGGQPALGFLKHSLRLLTVVITPGARRVTV